MNFDNILEKITGAFQPKQPEIVSPLPIGDTYTPALEHRAKFEEIRERQAAASNKLEQLYARPTATPTPAPPTPTQTVSKVLGAQAPTPTPGQDLWGQFQTATRDRAEQEGYDPDVIISQKALESNFGRSNFAKERNNFGGIGAYDRDPNQAFKFDDIADYLDYYFDLVENRYPEAYANRKNPRKYVEGLKKGGYASDPAYVDKVLRTPHMPR